MNTLKTSYYFSFVFVILFSCKEKSNELPISDKSYILEPKVELAKLENDFMKWWTYQSNTIFLSTDFNGFDEQSNKIDKKLFLQALTSGKFIPVRLSPLKGVEQYQLFELQAKAEETIVTTIKNTGLVYLHHYKMEGTIFPEFDITDLKGNHYTNESIKGTTTLFKTWFIKCVACIAEFPELNEFVEIHRSDMRFMSLALDSEIDLKTFLKTKPFDYETVANQRQLILKTLQLQSFPSHVVVDENGMILKVVNKASEMMLFLEASQKANEKVALFSTL